MVLLSSLAVAALAAAHPEFSVDGCSFGEAYAFGRAECRIHLHNTGDRTVSVQLRPQNSKDSVSPTSLVVPARGSADAIVHVDVGNAVGRISRGFQIRTEKGGNLVAAVNGFALTALDESRPKIEFGSIDTASLPAERTLELSSHDTAQFRIERVLGSPDGIDVGIGDDKRTLRVRLRDDAPLGILDDDIKLAIDTPRQREAWVHVSADVQGEVAVDSNPYWFGSVSAGHDRSIVIPMMSRSGREFRVGEVRVDMVKGKAHVEACEPPAITCKAIRLVFDDEQPAALTRAKLDIELPDLSRHLNLRIWGFLQNSAAARKADDSKLPMPPEPYTAAPWTEGIVDSVNAPVYAVPTTDPLDVASGPPPSTDPPPGRGPLLKWGTAGEEGAYGYQIFRADSEAGPFVLQNLEVIRVHGSEYASVPYYWRDTGATPGATYWYYIGVVYRDGHKQILSSPSKVVAK